MNDGHQGELFFDVGDGKGYESFQAEQEGRMEDLAKEMAIPLNRRVEILLKHSATPLTGVLRLAERGAVKNADARLLLKVGETTFEKNEISSCRVVTVD